MAIILSPEKKAFVAREIAAGGLSSEADAVARASALYECHLRRVREAIAEADREIAAGNGITLSADHHLDRIQAKAAAHNEGAAGTC